jgi:hypothetical protein
MKTLKRILGGLLLVAAALAWTLSLFGLCPSGMLVADAAGHLGDRLAGGDES